MVFRVVLLLMLLAAPCGAFELVPITCTIDPSQRGASSTFTVRNPGEEPIAIDVSMVRREMDENGNESLAPAEEQFIVMPAQLVLRPGQTRGIRVRWLGKGPPKQEEAFRLIAQELPVDFSEQKAEEADQPVGKVRVLVRYMASVYVCPRQARELVVFDAVARQNPVAAAISQTQPSVASPELRAADGSGPMLVVHLANRGTAHAILANVILRLQSQGPDGQTVVVDLKAEQLGSLLGENVLAGHRRRFLLPWPAGLTDAGLSGSILWQSPKR